MRLSQWKDTTDLTGLGYSSEVSERHYGPGIPPSLRVDPVTLSEPASLDSTFEVVDFARPYYSSTLGTKKIDGIVGEIKRVMELDSEHVIKVYGVRRDLSPKGWERLMILVERDTEGGKLGSWLPIEGYGEVLASVSYQ